jgi:hypothetical protein
LEHVLALAEKVDDDGIGKEIWPGLLLAPRESLTAPMI